MVVFYSPAKLHKCSCNSVAKFMTNCIGCLLTSTRCKRKRTFDYDNRDNRDNGLIVNSMLSVDNNKNNFYQPKGWLPLEIF